MSRLADVNSELELYRTQNLILLVGTNPLPDYVATLLLASEGGTVYLLHSPGTSGTGQIAGGLEQAIAERRPDVHTIPREIARADSGSIVAGVNEVLYELNSGSAVGLHYTGGTKAMAVHAYRAVERKFAQPVFSYLDAETLRLVVDARNGGPSRWVSVGRSVEVTLREMLRLHGYDTLQLRHEPCQAVLLLCQTLAKIHADPKAFGQWREWLDTLDSCEQLPPSTQYPLLKPVVEAFGSMCGGQATPHEVAAALNQGELKSCAKWLRGGWLEEYTLWAIAEVEVQSDLTDFGIDLEPSGTRQFQIDVAATIGYQLFALSCTTSDKKSLCKEHLLEAYVRACQIGGEEARIGLVSCHDRPPDLEAEIRESWFTGERVRVFGRQDLLKLPDALCDWFTCR